MCVSMITRTHKHTHDNIHFDNKMNDNIDFLFPAARNTHALLKTVPNEKLYFLLFESYLIKYYSIQLFYGLIEKAPVITNQKIA